MNKYICQIGAHKKTVMEAIYGFCEEMFEDKREVDPASITGNLALAQDLHRARRALSVLRVRYGLAGEGVHT